MSGNTRDPAQQASDATAIEAKRSTQVPVPPENPSGSSDDDD